MNFKKSWDIDFQKFKELCFSVSIFFFDKKAGKNTQLKKHLFFLFKVYYSPMVDYTERRKIKRKKKLNRSKSKKIFSLEYATSKALRGQYLCSFELCTDLPLG